MTAEEKELHNLVTELEVWRLRVSRVTRLLRQRHPTGFYFDRVTDQAHALANACEDMEKFVYQDGPKPQTAESCHLGQ